MTKHRSFLKWPGNKYRVLEHICPRLPLGTKLIEPFVGSGAVFLNTNYPRYLLNDVNTDLIQVYQLLQAYGVEFINYVEDYFQPKNNQPERYYALREKFNYCEDIWQRSALFIYLNRHGYNGLCRYNRSGLFNVPFGRYRQAYFPREEMEYFYRKSQRQVTFMCADFKKSMQRARVGHVVYCDPPYIPLTATASFTSYSYQPFLIEQQRQLVHAAESLMQRGISVLISNHDTSFIRKVYSNAQLEFFSVMRTISCKGQQRKRAPELLALYRGL
ncbi:MAG: Dam family site-specific DNA-(adenine-N6)-methyltransferase [Gammaproteobacteria bacterium]